MKARVTLKEGFRYYRNDNTFVDVKDGDIIDAGDMGSADYTARVAAKQLVPVDEKTATSVSAPNATDPLSPAGNIGLATKAQQAQRVKDLKAADEKEEADEDKKLADAQKAPAGKK